MVYLYLYTGEQIHLSYVALLILPFHFWFMSISLLVFQPIRHLSLIHYVAVELVPDN